MSIVDDFIYLKVISEKYEVFSAFDQKEHDGIHVYVNRIHRDQYFILKTDYGHSCSASFIKTGVSNRLPFLINKHCVFIKIQSVEQLKQLIDNAQ